MKKWSVKMGIKSVFHKDVAVGGLVISLAASVVVLTVGACVLGAIR